MEVERSGKREHKSAVDSADRRWGLRCKPRRTFTATTDSTHPLPVAPNLRGQKFESCRPNETWVTNLTYVPTGEGWLYLAGIKDLPPVRWSAMRLAPG